MFSSGNFFAFVQKHQFGGLLLLREADRRLGLTRLLASCVQDRRDPNRISHAMEEMLLFRMMTIACGQEDADDCDTLRDDQLFKLAAGRLPESGAVARERGAVVLAADHEPVREHAHADRASARDAPTESTTFAVSKSLTEKEVE